MPLVRYFLFVGTALLALLFIVDACLPQLPVVESANTAANANTATDLSVIRIHSDRKWPERVEFDTSLPVTMAAPVRTAEASVPATAPDGTAPIRMRDAFAQLQTAQLQTSEPNKLERTSRHHGSRAAKPAALETTPPAIPSNDLLS